MSTHLRRLRKVRLERQTETIIVLGDVTRHLTTPHGDIINRELTPLPAPTIDEQETQVLPTIALDE